MTIQYRKVQATIEGTVVETDTIERVNDNLFFPKDPKNRHYQEYLAWLAEGNEPLPADEPS